MNKRYSLTNEDFILMALINIYFAYKRLSVSLNEVLNYKNNVLRSATMMGYEISIEEDKGILKQFLDEDSNTYSLKKDVTFSDLKKWFLSNYNIDLIFLLLDAELVRDNDKNRKR